MAIIVISGKYHCPIGLELFVAFLSTLKPLSLVSSGSPLVTVVRIKTNSAQYSADFMANVMTYGYGTGVAFAVW